MYKVLVYNRLNTFIFNSFFDIRLSLYNTGFITHIVNAWKAHTNIVISEIKSENVIEKKIYNN